MGARILAGFILLMPLFGGYFPQVAGQGQVDLSAGFGLPELLHIGVRYQINQFQVGGGVGFMPVGGGESVLSIFTDGCFHFAGHSRHSDRRPWYGKTGLNYLRDQAQSATDSWVYLNARIGRDFNFSERLGIALDVGAGFELSHTTANKHPSSGGGWTFSIDTPPVIPSICLGLFVRL